MASLLEEEHEKMKSSLQTKGKMANARLEKEQKEYRTR